MKCKKESNPVHATYNSLYQSIADGQAPKYRGLFHTLMTIFKEEGFSALYKGYAVAICPAKLHTFSLKIKLCPRSFMVTCPEPSPACSGRWCFHPFALDSTSLSAIFTAAPIIREILPCCRWVTLFVNLFPLRFYSCDTSSTFCTFIACLNNLFPLIEFSLS
jgi:hypothetical protein